MSKEQMKSCTETKRYTGRIRRAILLPTILLGLALVSSIVVAIDFSDADLAELKAGNTIHRELPTSGTKGFYGGSGWAVVNVPEDVIWKALVDWNAYTTIFPNTTEATELSRKGTKSLVRFKLGHPLVSLTYRLFTAPDHIVDIFCFSYLADEVAHSHYSRGPNRKVFKQNVRYKRSIIFVNS